MRALVLDFDGVISESAPEAFVVALQTYADLWPISSLAMRLSRLTDAMRFEPARIRADPLYVEFLDRMPLGNRAEDYCVMLETIEQSVAVPDQASYDRIQRSKPPDILQDFHARFYANRARLAQANEAGWRGLFGSYPPFIELLRRRATETELAIATAKDRESVMILLAHYGIDDLFPVHRVLDKNTGVTKVAHLEHIHGYLDIPYPEITFIDDKVNHLDSIAGLGVRCALAAWGYNGPRQHRLAEDKGYLVCSLENAEA